MKVKTESEVAQLCQTPSDPMDCSLPLSCIHGIFQARVLEWGAIAFSDYDLRYTQISATDMEYWFCPLDAWLCPVGMKVPADPSVSESLRQCL